MSTPAVRSLPLVWGAIAAGGTIGAVALALVRPDPPAMPEHADAAFYLVALLSVAANAAALALVRRLDIRAADAPDAEAARAVVQSHGILALAVAEVPALASGVAAFLTGNVLALAFVVPFLAVVALTWPAPERVARWTADR